MENDKPQNMPPVPPFVRFVCANVPMVFDDSLSYYEALCALWKYVQSMTDVINNNATLEEEFIEKVKALEIYVRDYFDNLDVQEEINKKLDAMVEDGTLTTIIGSYVDSYVAETNDRLDTVETNITSINTSIDKLESNMNGIVGIQAVGAKHYILYSPDCINFSIVSELPSGVGGDSCSLHEIEGKYYLFGNNKYWYTEDFVTWTNGGSVKSSYEYDRIWASSAYYDEDNSTVYIYSSYQYSNDTHASPFGGTTYYFKIGYQTATINNDGTLNINQTIHDLVYEVGESYIDPYVAKDPYLGYLIAYKDEFTAKVYVAVMNSLTSVSSTNVKCVAFGVEAPQLITDIWGTVVYVDGYGLNAQSKTGISSLPIIRGNLYRVSNTGTLYEEKYTGLTPLNMPVAYHHLGIMRCSKKAFYLIEQLGIKPTLNSTCNILRVVDGMIPFSINSVSSPTLVNFPNTEYTVSTAKTVTLKFEFVGEPIRIYAFKGTVLTWSSDSTIQSQCKNKTFTVANDQLIEFYPSTNDILTGTWVPIDRA